MTNEELLELPLEKIHFTILDVETTGMSPAYEKVIEVGAVKYRNSKKIDTFHKLINPGKYIPYGITQLTGITNAEVEDAPLFEEISDDLVSFLDNTVFVAHNARFDLGFIQSELVFAGIQNYSPIMICTVRLAHRLYPELKSKSLKSLCEHLKIKNISPHRGLADAEATAKLFKKMLDAAISKFGLITLADLVNLQYTPVNSLRKEILNEQYRNIFSDLPHAPGVYYFLDKNNQIVYIGKAKSLRERIKSYISSTASEKSKHIINTSEKLVFQRTNTELTAMMLESEMIKSIMPINNIMLKRYTSKSYLRVDKAIPFPTFEVCSNMKFDGNDYYGIFNSRKDIEKLKDLIDRSFMLRECSDKELNAKRKCYLLDIERCLAPCIEPDISKYEEEIGHVRNFLSGNNTFALTRLVNKMKFHSNNLNFELAGEVKKNIDLILSQIQKSALLHEPINTANVLIEVADNPETKDYLLLLEGKTYIRNYPMNPTENFDSALDSYFEGTVNRTNSLKDEDLEKLKTILSWCSRNKQKIKIYYLKDYTHKDKLAKTMAESKKISSSQIHELSILGLVKSAETNDSGLSE